MGLANGDPGAPVRLIGRPSATIRAMRVDSFWNLMLPDHIPWSPIGPGANLLVEEIFNYGEQGSELAHIYEGEIRK